MSIKYGGLGHSLRTLGVGAGVVRVAITEVLRLSEYTVRVMLDNTFGVEIDYQLFTGFKVNSVSGNATPLGGQIGDNFIDLVFSTPVDLTDPWAVVTPINIGSRRVISLQSGTVGGTAGAITVSSLTSTTAEFPGDTGLITDTYLVPASMPHPTYMFAVGNSTGRLYRMAEGDSAWTRTGYTTQLNLSGYVYSFSNGAILAKTAAGPLVRSAPGNNGEAFSEVIGPSSAVNFSATGYPIDWSFSEGPNGKALLVEYGAISGDNKVGPLIFYTSDYGVTWSIALDTTSLPAGEQWNHLHAVHYHAATGKFVVAVGDAARARVFTLDDDGTNLTNLLDQPNAAQPVWFVDGIGNEVLFGDDTHAQIAVLNVATGAVRQVFQGWRGVVSTFDWCWHITKYAGLYYAFQYQSSVYSYMKKESVLLVSPSPDGPWTVAYVFGSTIQGCLSFAGFMNGLLHFKVKRDSDNGKHWAVNPVELTVKGASAANGTRTNTESATAATSHAAPWFQYYGTLSTETGLGIAGTDCVKYVANGNSANTPQFGRASGTLTGAVTAGKVYQAACWVKVISNRDLQMLVGYSLNASVGVGVKHTQYFPSGVWTLAKSPAFLVPSGVTRASIQFQINNVDNIAGDPPAMLFDRVMVTEAPIPDEWIANGSPLAETAHAGTLEARPKWTDIFWFESVESHHRLLSYLSFCDVPHCIRSWKVGSAAIELWMHAGAKSTLNGAPTNVANSVVTANGSIFRADMVGNVLHAGKLDNTAGSYTKIIGYTSPTVVTVADNISARLNGENVAVEDPRFELRITNGGSSESIWSPRIPWLAGSGIGFAVQVAGASDDKVRAWAMFGGTLHAFDVSANEHAVFLDAEVTTHFGASSLTAERAFSAAVGKFLHIGDYGYVPEDQLPDVIPTGTFDDSTPAWIPNDVKVNLVAQSSGGQANTHVGWEFSTHTGGFVSLLSTNPAVELTAADVQGLQIQVDGIWYSPIAWSGGLNYLGCTYAVGMDSSLSYRWRTREVNIEFYENAEGDLPDGLEFGKEGNITPYS
jgi:hypothetical protein